MIKIILLIVNFCLTTAIFADELPNLNDPSNSLFNQITQKKLGEEYMIRIRQSGLLVLDPIVSNYIQNMGYRLVANSDSQGQPFHFFVIASPIINASTGPNAYIGIDSGLITETATESELAGVTAHEIAHVTQHHLSRAYESFSTARITAIAGILAAIAVGGKNPELASGALSASLAGAAQQGINFTRENEKEADRVGIQTLYNAGFDPRGMPDFFAKLLQYEKINNYNIPSFLNDHPMTDDRIADTLNRANQYKFKPVKPSLSYQLVRERLRVLTADNAPQLLNYYQQLLKDPKTQNLAYIRYGYALTLKQMNKFSQAAPVLQQLQIEHPHELIIPITLAQVYRAANEPEKAVQLLKPSMELYGDDYPLFMEYGADLLAANQAKPAVALLKTQIADYPEDVLMYDLLSQAQAKSGDLAHAYLNRAQAELINGYTHDAIQQLNTALKLPQLNPDTKLQIQARLDEIEGKPDQGLRTKK